MINAKKAIKGLQISQDKSDWPTVTRCIKQIKFMLSNDKKHLEIFRRLNLTATLVSVLKCTEDNVLLHSLSILSSCLLEESFRREFHRSGIPDLCQVFKMTKSLKIRHRACRVIGQQCVHQESCSSFHSFQIAGALCEFLDDEQSGVEEKHCAVRTFRYLVNTSPHLEVLLGRKAVYNVCRNGLSTEDFKLTVETLTTIVHYMKWQSGQLYTQVLGGTDDLQVLSKVSTAHGGKVSVLVLQVLLFIFFRHSSYATAREYQYNCRILDCLSMAKFPSMIVSELKTQNSSIQSCDESKLIFALCDFCTLGKNWKKFSYNVVPMYHERTWHQLTECGGIELFVALMTKYSRNFFVLEKIFRALSTLEYLHSTKTMVLWHFKSLIIPLLPDVFDSALEKIEAGDSTKGTCHHREIFPKGETSSSHSSKEMSKVILELIETSTSDPEESGVKCNANGLVVRNGEREKSGTLASIPVVYRSMNKIKFRTGNKKKGGQESTKAAVTPEKGSLNSVNECSLDSQPVADARGLNIKSSSNSRDTEKNIIHYSYKILEYINRLLYQITVSKDADITYVCRTFLLRVYKYISKAEIVHASSMKLLNAVAKNSSSIQWTLDNLLIPKLAVDLIESQNPDCQHCVTIMKGVEEYLVGLRHYFNHYHQYGQYEIANRINPSKSDFTKQSCLVAVTHVVKCPKLLYNFLIEHRGLESLMFLLKSEVDTKMLIYGLVSSCAVINNLKVEYYRKYQRCLDCESHYNAERDREDHFIKREDQLHSLTSILNGQKPLTASVCLLEREVNSNCSFRFKEDVIHVNKEVLSDKNEVLKNMMFGSFCESKENVIEMSNINFSSMRMVIHFLYGCTCQIFYVNEADVYVELLFLAGMYFIPELKIVAVHYLSNLLSPEDLVSFMEIHGKIIEPDVQQHLIQAVLGQVYSYKYNINSINKVLSTSFCIPKDAFISHLHSGLKQLLSSTRNLCNCDKYRTYM